MLIRGTVCKNMLSRGTVCKNMLSRGTVCENMLSRGTVCKNMLIRGTVCKITLIRLLYGIILQSNINLSTLYRIKSYYITSYNRHAKVRKVYLHHEYVRMLSVHYK